MKTPINALIIDDNPVDSALLKRYLEKLTMWQVDCAVCKTEREALTKVKEFFPDVIFVDYLLGRETGTNLIRSFKKAGHNSAYILVTGTGDENVAKEAFHAGASDYITKKELSPKTLERTIRHVMEKKRVEQEMHKSREGLLAAQAIANVGNWDWNIVTGDISWSDEIYRIFGLTPQEFNATYEAFMESVHPDDRESVINALNEAVEHRKNYNIKHRVVRPDGTERIVHERGVVYRDDGGKPLRMIGAVHDITEHKHAEELASRFGRILDESYNEIYIFDTVTLNFVQINKGALQNIGYTMEEMKNLTALDLKPELTMEKFLELINPLKTGEREYIVFNTVHKRKDGSLYPVEVRLHLSSMEMRPVFVAIIHDITERKQAEGKLRMASKVIESAADGIFVTDLKSVIQSVNSALIEITGYSEEELIGEKPNIWRSDHHDKSFYQNMWASLLRDGHWYGEIWNRRKSGEAFPARLTISAIKDANGVTNQYACIMHDMTEIKESQREVEHRAYHDALTGLPNRQLFMDRLDQSINRAKIEKHIFGVLFIDLDNFKNINDSMGHTAGDEVLKNVASRLISSSRETDTVARLSGDEFAVIVEKIELEQEAGIIALRTKEMFAEPFIQSGEELFLSVSIGIALYPANGATAQEILKNADMAMYQVKKRGKDDLHYFTESLNEAAQKRLKLEKNLRRAVTNDEFAVYYQPKVDMQTGKITGMEALVRWIQADGTVVSPADFIPVAEETGLIIPIGKTVFKKACRHAVKLQQTINAPIKVAVNLSAKQFQEKGIISAVKSILKSTGMAPSQLEIEITESMVMTDMETAIETMNAFSKMGIHISIDDFGTGYSSLGYLKRFPINSLKIDQSFVRDIVGDSNNDSEKIASAIIAMSKSLNLKVIAEGVETVEQLEFLREQGCDEMQGYLFSKPLPGDEFEKLLQDGTELYSHLETAGPPGDRLCR